MTTKLKRPEIIRVYIDDLEDHGHGKYIGAEYWHEGKPFTGFVVFDYYKNGNIEGEQEYVNGQTMGWRVMYYENGEIEYESLYYGATGICYKEYDKNGNVTDEGFVAPKELYNEVAKEIGIEPIKL
jgi:antitoxin component YwqK of YwqJK toxin-antitoxin module